MNYDHNQLAKSLLAQLTLPSSPLNSKSVITVTCQCSTVVTLNYRAFLRKWAKCQQYLCKKCHVRTYCNNANRIQKFRESFSKVAKTEAHRQRCRENGQLAWADPDKRQQLIDTIIRDNQTNPKKTAARAKAQEALRSKDWYHTHLSKMRALAAELTRSNKDEFAARANGVHNEYYNYSEVVYVNKDTNVIIMCPVHGRFQQTPHNHLQGKGCRFCSTYITNPHNAILEMIPPGVAAEINNRTVINPAEIDIWFPGRLVGIEINGEYWHGIRPGMTAKELTYQRLRHQHKAELAKLANIKLLQFWTHEIEHKPDLIKSMIWYHLGLANRIAARKCRKRKISNNEARDFFARSHLQGHRDALITYALYDDNDIACALSLTTHPTYNWEIMRYAVKPYHHVVGGFSRLLAAFEHEYSPNQIITYADRRISTGGLYRQNGFTDLGATDPNYFYWKRGVRLSRQQAQKKKLRSLLGANYQDNLSEVRNMLQAGYTRVFDAGHQKLLKSHDTTQDN